MSSQPTYTHKEVCIKVNAYVDEKIAPVIESLSKIQDVITEFSCEDNRSEVEINAGYIPRAYIVFHAKKKYENWRELSEICNTLSKAISNYSHAEVSIKWREGKPVGMLEFNTDDAYWLTLAINELTKD